MISRSNLINDIKCNLMIDFRFQIWVEYLSDQLNQIRRDSLTKNLTSIPWSLRFITNSSSKRYKVKVLYCCRYLNTIRKSFLQISNFQRLCYEQKILYKKHFWIIWSLLENLFNWKPQQIIYKKLKSFRWLKSSNNW
jgi:hypothetical protein